MSSTFCPDADLLQRALAGDLLSPEQSEGLARHLEACGECAALLQEMPDEDRLLAVARGAAPRPGQPPLPEPLVALLQRLKALQGSATPAPGDTANSGDRTPTPGAAVTAALDPPQGPDELGRIGPYRVLRELGAGGMGIVFLAEDPRLKRQVAVKLMRPTLAANPAARRRFQREAEAMAAVEHDHIVAVYQVGEHRGAPFLAMPLLKGESLESRLQREPRLPLPELLRIGREIAEGLAAAHERGLIHRDVKPGNLWLEEGRGRVKVLDFGLARPTEGNSQLTQEGMIVGTPSYMAPEQAAGQPVDHRGDLFSFGCVLYRMATGRPPFAGKTTWEVLYAVTHAEPEPPHARHPELPLPLSSLIQWLLCKDRERRPASARAVLKALDGLLPAAAVAPPAEGLATEAALPTTLPVIEPVRPKERPRRGAGLLPLLPAAFLLVALSLTAAHDALPRAPGPAGQPTDDGGGPPLPPALIGLEFHDSEMTVTLGDTGVKPVPGAGGGARRRAVWAPSMRFGLILLNENTPPRLSQAKRLTAEEKGFTNNCVVRLDGNEWLFGERPFRVNGQEEGSWPGRWQELSRDLGPGRDGKRSVWAYDEQHVTVTQTAEVVASGQSGYRDTCLVRYRLENKDDRPHTVGLRFLLDTFIGGKDEAPFLFPGEAEVCDTSKDLNGPERVPDFIQAIERPNLADPGTVAELAFRLGNGVEGPGRVTLGAWPDKRLRRLDPLCLEEKTLWEVPVLPIKSLPPGDSAVTMYWNERPLSPGEAREVGFSYRVVTAVGR